MLLLACREGEEVTIRLEGRGSTVGRMRGLGGSRNTPSEKYAFLSFMLIYDSENTNMYIR